MKTASKAPQPRIEALLASAHRDYDSLRERRRALERTGIGSSHLPDDLALMSFALLGSHERGTLLTEIRGYWSTLQSKGLVYGAVDDASTAELRLLQHVQEHAESIGPVWQQLQEAINAPEPPDAIWRCAKYLEGSWGQPARIHFSVQGARYLLIDPDPVFRRQRSLVAANPNTRHTGTFIIPVDNGAVKISLLDRNGQVFRHVIQARVKEML